MAEQTWTEDAADFLAWPPDRYLAAGFYADAARKTLRPELQGAFALKSAFGLLAHGATAEGAVALAGALAREATPGAQAPAALARVADRLVQSPLARQLALYDFFRACAGCVRDARDLEALAAHVAAVADRLAHLEALRAADLTNVSPGLEAGSLEQ